MARHAEAVLTAIDMQELPVLFGEAIENEKRRLAFWATQAEGMLLDPAANNLAREALDSLRYRPDKEHIATN